MASNYTENYQLNQWEAGDRVLRTDFNGDNVKIDSALKAEADARTALAGQVAQKADKTALAAEASAREALAGELRPRAGAQLLKSGRVTEDCESFQISTTGINWNEWLAIHVVIDYQGPAIIIRTNSSPNFVTSSGGTCNSDSEAQKRYPFSLHLYPMFDERSAVGGFFLSHDEIAGYLRVASIHFKDLKYFTVVANTNNNILIRKGSSYKIWGSK